MRLSKTLTMALATFVIGSAAAAAPIKGSLVGWGNDTYGQTDVPLGNDFVAISAGGSHSLALRSDGSLVAWGDNRHGQTNVPPGNRFVVISAGLLHNVAIQVAEPASLTPLLFGALIVGLRFPRYRH